jgi:hypothetical protein
MAELLGDPVRAIRTSLALLMGVQLLGTGWVATATFGAIYRERIADRDRSLGQNWTVESPSRLRR